MAAKDRLFNCLLIGAALVAWIVVAEIVTTTYPRQNASTGLVGAGFIGLACGLTTVPLFWLVPFARHRRIALRRAVGLVRERRVWLRVVLRHRHHRTP